MRKSILILSLVSVSALAGCLQTDGERALAGAAAGAVVADATDNNALTGAALGALAGTYCDDAGICN
ncbi:MULTISPECIES: glycine zipper 2TM domain-containing protein [unclassified Celeribacter]|uniref:glycine zipper 2TM domain-containing protein n=1 Tax=unclassified Celeribacter TaxID=2618893 RepID=UPI00142FF770|nr:glycine zipper 2TM domain-containing protein [Celeribacter sp. HF31]NIY78174.1 glycine zipper 2TM domain-containing protein [Celeribacter sp. HF31]